MTNEEFIKSISFDGEEWKDIPGYEGLYMISSFGRCASLDRVVKFGWSYRHTGFKLLSPNIYIHKTPIIGTNGINIYKKEFYHLYKNKRERKSILVHRLVASAFIPNPNNYPDIDHIDGNPLNNRIENLRWCTRKMNMNNPVTSEKLKNASNYRRSLKGIPRELIKTRIVKISDNGSVEFFESLSEAGRKGFKYHSILSCCENIKSKYKGFKWMYLDEYKNQINKSKNSF